MFHTDWLDPPPTVCPPIFFLKRVEELHIFILRRNGGSKIDHYKLSEGWFYTAHYSPSDNTRPKLRLLKSVAPAMHHKVALFLMSRIVLCTSRETPSKTHALRCFRKHHTSEIRELNPKRACLGTFNSAAHHHSWKISFTSSGVHLYSPTRDNTRNQTSLENTHEIRMWWMVSFSCSHSMQCIGWSSPRRASRSAIQQRLRDASDKEFAPRQSPSLPYPLICRFRRICTRVGWGPTVEIYHTWS
jgi:hypothetical protein